MNGTRIDQDQSTRRRTVFSALMSKGLAPACDEADYIIIMAVPWIRMSNVVGMQQFHIEPGVMHNFRPFLRLHNYSLPMLYHTQSRMSCRILPCSIEKLLLNYK